MVDEVDEHAEACQGECDGQRDCEMRDERILVEAPYGAQYEQARTNVATKVPSTAWLDLSRMKFRSSRGPSCDDARDSATSVIENTTPAMVTIELAMVPSNTLAPSAPPL